MSNKRKRELFVLDLHVDVFVVVCYRVGCMIQQLVFHTFKAFVATTVVV